LTNLSAFPFVFPFATGETGFSGRGDAEEGRLTCAGGKGAKARGVEAVMDGGAGDSTAFAAAIGVLGWTGRRV